MSDIEVIIKIPEKVKQAFDRAESDDLKGGYYDHGGVIGNAIKNGIVLPKGHGRLIDADKIANEVSALRDNWNRYRNEYESGRYESYDYAVDTIKDAPTIIEAESEDK